MIDRIWTFVSLGERPLAAGVMYLGLGLMLAALLPGPAAAVAACDPYVTCNPGYVCCGGGCVPEDYVCCDDGSSGPGSTCICCTGCEEGTCTEPSTLVCDDGSGGGGGEHGEHGEDPPGEGGGGEGGGHGEHGEHGE